jgi:hypothetical protein
VLQLRMQLAAVTGERDALAAARGNDMASEMVASLEVMRHEMKTVVKMP